MKVNELLMNIHNKEFKLESGLQTKKYLPMEAKKAIAQGIIYECTEEENGTTRIDSVQRYMSYVKYMITMHTNLEYTDDNYDALCSTMYGEKTLLNAIMDTFEADAKECLRILNLMFDDLAYESSIEYKIGAMINNVNSALNSLIEEMKNKVVDINMDDIDIKQLIGYLNTINK